MKKSLFILIFLVCNLFPVGSLEFGIHNSVNIINMEENEYLPDYLVDTETFFLVSEDFFIKSLFLTLKPSLHISNEKLSFKFYEIKFSAVFNNFAVSAGKFNNYWGKAMIKNNYFPDVKNIMPIKDNFWNLNLNFLINNFTFNGGIISDTNSIDDFNLPEWNSYYLLAEFSHPYISVGIICNLYQEENKEYDFKSTGELVITYFPNLTFYGDGSLKLFNITTGKMTEDFSFVSGVTFQSRMNYLNFFSQLELGFAKFDFFYGGLISLELNNTFQISTQLIYKSNQLILVPKIGYEFKHFNCYIEAVTENILDEFKMAVISTGVSYEF